MLAGPGNNGGDAWVAANLLHAAWFKVTVVAIGEPKAAIAQESKATFLANGGKVFSHWPEGPQDLVLDGLLGIGLTRAPSPEIAALIDRANASGLPVLSLDVPSGLDADRGVTPGASVRATDTLTFISDKPGLHTGVGVTVAGKVHVATLSLDEYVAQAECGWLMGESGPATKLPARSRDSHKGNFGATGIIGGSRGMVGAAVLASRAALFAGSGKVFLGALDDSLGNVDWLFPEVMYQRPRDLIDQANISSLVVGPGLGLADAARALVELALKSPARLILDADALNLLAKGRALQSALKRRSELSILTPHPAEAGRLLGIDTGEVNADRIAAACAIASRFGAITVLKGAGTVIAHPDGRWIINSTGNPGMSVAGMGDVLSGLLGALMAQGMTPWDAACLGVWAHGKAADICLSDAPGPVGLTPGEVAKACRQVLNR